MKRATQGALVACAALCGFGLGASVAVEPAPLPCRQVVARTTEGEACVVVRCAREVSR